MEPRIESQTEDGIHLRLPVSEVEPASALHDEPRKFRNPLLDSNDTLSSMRFFFVLGIAVALCGVNLHCPYILRSRLQFKSWYNQYSYQFNIIAKDNCTDAYAIYLYGTRQNISVPTLSGAGNYTIFIQPMVDCLLTNASEYIKYQLSTSQVMLGITPTIICLLEATSEEVCFCALIGRRRLLGILLSVASPSIYTERAFKYQDPDQILRELNDDHVKSTVITRPRWFFVVLEDLAVLAAIGNTASLNWELGVRSINSLSANNIYMPMLWSCLGICAHFMGAIVLDMRARRLDEATMEAKAPPTIRTCFSLQALGHHLKFQALETILRV